jgi:hypothetical protein
MWRWVIDFADGPVFGPVKPVQVVDLFGRQHRSSLFIRQKRFARQKDVVCKTEAGGAEVAQVLLLPTLGP